MLRPSSVAAACNSKLNERQKRLRSASPQALFTRAPKGACMMSCMPPPSSKKRSAMIVRCVGTSPSTARPVTMYSTSCSAPASSSPHSSFSHATAAWTSGLEPIPRRRALGLEEPSNASELLGTASGAVLGSMALSWNRSSPTCETVHRFCLALRHARTECSVERHVHLRPARVHCSTRRA